jgi:hypothetical protein
MISLVKIMESESNVDKFTFKQRDAGGVSVPNPSYNNIKLVKQGTAKDYIKYKVMVGGKYGGTIWYNKTDKSMIANGGESNTTFPPKKFKSIKDAIDYIGGNSTRSYNTNIPLAGMDTSFNVKTYN